MRVRKRKYEEAQIRTCATLRRSNSQIFPYNNQQTLKHQSVPSWRISYTLMFSPVHTDGRECNLHPFAWSHVNILYVVMLLMWFLFVWNADSVLLWGDWISDWRLEFGAFRGYSPVNHTFMVRSKRVPGFPEITSIRGNLPREILIYAFVDAQWCAKDWNLTFLHLPITHLWSNQKSYIYSPIDNICRIPGNCIISGRSVKRNLNWSVRWRAVMP